VVFVVATAAAGSVLALTFAKVIGEWELTGMIMLGGSVLGFPAGESVLGWMRGSVSEGPMMLAMVVVIATAWAVASARSAAHWKRMEANQARAREIVLADPSRYRLPPVRIEPHGLPSRARLSAARASYSASFLSQADPVQRRATPPVD
jgi:hypothetical protein